MSAPDRVGTEHGQHLTEGGFRLVAQPDDLAHLVCCRDVSWRKALCGAVSTEINLAAETACSMCLEEAEAMSPGILARLARGEVVCPVDGNPCPDEDELDARILRESDPEA